MSPALFAEIDGKHIPLDECDWVLWRACGCLQGVTVGATAFHVTATEDEAWRHFYDDGTHDDIAKAKARGEQIELVTHQRWRDEICDRMMARCTHGRSS